MKILQEKGSRRPNHATKQTKMSLRNAIKYSRQLQTIRSQQKLQFPRNRRRQERQGSAFESSPEVGAPGEDEAVEPVGGAHGLHDDIGEGPGAEALRLDVVAERREVAVHRSELGRRDRHLVRPRPRRGGGQGSGRCGPLLRRRRLRLRRGGHRAWGG